MKKILSLLMALTVVLSCVGCGSSGGSSAGNEDVNSEVVKTDAVN